MTPADWRWVLDVNLYGVIHGVHAFLPVLERNADWGHVVSTSSLSVMLAPPHAAAYVASKAAVLGLTEVLAAELRAAGSQVGATALLPGAVTSNIRNSLRSRPATGTTALYEVDLRASGRDFRFLEPRAVGEMVVQAVRDDQPYVNTHGEYAAQITARAGEIAHPVCNS